ncbi:hypothetical protein SteCoe_33320 [Stentor coeruleus]|uniref:non-specific serine/threonine protein kinase n=1 Tax=Stentor coeruleus TaxID=5963 RepID=A0A1R2AX35_9CILI|nr:hypothetical protein SteCoe_33320 [Stentor coeruleus]
MDKYEFIQYLGKGSFGAVSKIRRKSDNKILVWKEINYKSMKEKERQQLVCEVNILRELRHPNIVKYYDRIIDKPNSKIYIVMEYCEKGDMAQMIKKSKRDNDYLSEDVIWKIFMQILLALQACHDRDSRKILHRDIKPGNVLLDGNMNVKLGDFGLSRILGENSIYAETRVGTPYYMSPEQITDSRYNEKSDIWSAGCLLYEMTTLNPPFQAKSQAELAHKINLGQTERIPIKYSEDLQRVISWMMAVDYNLRPTVTDILNLPQVTMRIKERQAKDSIQQLKDLEVKLKEREDNAKMEKEKLIKREEEIVRREKRIRDRQQDRDSDRVFEREREREEREKELELQREIEKERQRQKEIEIDKERQRQKEIELDREREKERQRQKEIELDREREKERQRQKEIEIEKEKEKEKERQRQRELEFDREREREREKERQRLKEREEKIREREREFQKAKEKELQKLREREEAKIRERELELEKSKEKELEKAREREEIKTRERERELEKARERERLRLKKVEDKYSPLTHNHNSYSYEGGLILKDQKPTSLSFEKRDSPSTRYSAIGASLDHKEPQTIHKSLSTTYEKTSTSLTRFSPLSTPTQVKKDQYYTRFSPKNESPSTKPQIEKHIDDYKSVTAKVTRPTNVYRHADSAGKIVRDSPGNFRRAENRRESPRYAEPVRKHSDRGGYVEGGYKKDTNLIRSEGKKGSGDFGYGIPDRAGSADRRIQKIPNSPIRDTPPKSGEYYKNSPTARQIPRPRTMDANKESPRRTNIDEAGKTFPHTFDNIWKHYTQNEHKSTNQITANTNKPPVRRNKPY